MILDQYGKEIHPRNPNLLTLKYIGKMIARQFERESIFAGIMRTAELRKSCGVEPSGGDTIKIRTRIGHT